MSPFVTRIDLLLEYIKSEDYLKSFKTNPNRINFADFKEYLEKRDDVDSNNMILEFDYDKYEELRKISSLVFKNVELENITISGFGKIEGDYSIHTKGNFKTDSFIVENSNITFYIHKEDVGNSGYIFESCEFKEIKLTSQIFDRENQSNRALSFLECKIDKFSTVGYKYFANRINFESCEFKEISLTNKIFNSTIGFYECQFNGKVNFTNSEFNNNAIFVDSKFGNEAIFNNSKFNHEVFFNNSEFKYRVDFNNSKFNDNVSFVDSIFDSYSYFKACKFEQIANFNDVVFNKFPDFSTCFFKGPRAVNFINVDISIIDFESIEKYINENIKEDKNYNDLELKIKCARIIRDSSRVIKDILISQNNPIDAQTWHKLELYARENELKLESKLKKSNIFSTYVDNFLLFIYRNTSDHHTNFLKILNFTILVISINAVFLYALKCFIENFTFNPVLTIFFVFILLILIIFLSILINHFIKVLHHLIFILVILCSPSLILPFTGIFSINVDKNQVLTKYLNNMDNQDLINIIKKSDIKDLDTKLLEAKHIELTKTITQNKDKISEKINKKLQRVLFKSKAYDRAKEIANLIYTIILLLCIYSLQKTARKNSLIPS